MIDFILGLFQDYWYIVAIIVGITFIIGLIKKIIFLVKVAVFLVIIWVASNALGIDMSSGMEKTTLSSKDASILIE